MQTKENTVSRVALEKKIREKLGSANLGRYDFLPVYEETEIIRDIVKYLVRPYRGLVDYVAGPEPMGFILGGMVAQALGVGFVPLRREGTLPYQSREVLSASFIDYTNNARALEMRVGTLREGDRVLLVDEWVGTAATIEAAKALLEEQGAKLIGIASIGADCRQGAGKMIENDVLRSIIMEL